MERIKSLNLYQKVILFAMIIMVMVFAVVYSVTSAKEGFEYKDTILIPTQENGNTVYSGKIQGTQAKFTVYANKKVEFQYGDKTYGPYIAKEDSTAIPKDSELGEHMTGVELRCGKEIIFRGGVLDDGSYLWIYNEDGSAETGITMTIENGIVTDENGNVIDQMKPTASTILDLMANPKLTHKGSWAIWLGGVFICFLTAISILYADELFRCHLKFRIQNADDAEPSEWEIAGRYITWIALPIMAMIIFFMGLR